MSLYLFIEMYCEIIVSSVEKSLKMILYYSSCELQFMAILYALISFWQFCREGLSYNVVDIGQDIGLEILSVS